MKKDIEQTVVVFRKFKHIDAVIALFPYIEEGFRYQPSYIHVLSYMHVGQHSSADYNHCIKTSRPATEDEYKELKKELESLGYNLKVRLKRTSTTRMKK